MSSYKGLSPIHPDCRSRVHHPAVSCTQSSRVKLNVAHRPKQTTLRNAAQRDPQSSQPNMPPTSRSGTFYFAYGSNLSPEQMAGRCSDSPKSSEPVAIARLDGWEWFICQRGYANVAPSQTRPQPRSQSRYPSQSPPKSGPSQAARPQPPPSSKAGAAESSADVVWGIVYNLTPADEGALDGFEGHSKYRNPLPRPNDSSDPEQLLRKPFLQGNWDYNKMHLPLKITNWLQDPQQYGLSSSTEGHARVTAMVYVDEKSMEAGRASLDYVKRMNRAIAQSTALGIPSGWVDSVMRKSIAEGPMPDDFGESRAGPGPGPRGRGGGERGGERGRGRGRGRVPNNAADS
jgi:hypothetical protein